MTDNRNTILAVILSGLVLIAWQYFYNVPQMEKQRAQSQTQAELAKPTPQATPGSTAPQAGSTPPANAPRQPAGRRPRPSSAATPRLPPRPRVKIDTPRMTGSISLKGARIDDLSLVQFRETVDPDLARDRAVLAVEHGQPLLRRIRLGAGQRLDRADSRPEHGVAAGRLRRLTPSNPVTLKYDNGEGLTFRRTIAIDDRYLFTIKDDVTNVGNAPVTLYPFALISRHGTPQVSGYYILHEGLIGYLGDQGLQEYGYKKIDDAKAVSFKVTDGWLGITDKYWASALLPDTNAQAAGALLVQSGRHGPDLSDRLSAGSADHRDRRHRQRQCAAVRRRQGSQRRRHQFPARRPRRLQQAARAQPFRSPDRLGLVLLHHQADVPGARLLLPPGRQFRRRHPAGDGAGEAAVLPARQQVLRLDGEDEVGAAATGRAEGALSRRQGRSSSRR